MFKYLFALGDGVFDGTYIEEGLLGQMVAVAVEYHLEAPDGIGYVNHHSWHAGELFGHAERLAEETLHPAGAVHRELVLVGEFIHTQDGYDVLQFLVALQDLLHPLGRFVMVFAHDVGVEDARSALERVHRGVDAEGSDLAAEHGGRIEMAEGAYISLLDHDDVLHPAALHDVMEAICKQDADLIYTDEATFQSPKLENIVVVHFKPDFAPDNLRANNYICHFTTIRRSLLDRCGAFRKGYDGAQDHDLMLRLTQAAKCIIHIPKVLYYWRASPQSTAASERNKPFASAAGIKAVKDNLTAAGIEARVESSRGIPTIYRVSYALQSPPPKHYHSKL